MKTKWYPKGSSSIFQVAVRYLEIPSCCTTFWNIPSCRTTSWNIPSCPTISWNTPSCCTSKTSWNFVSCCTTSWNIPCCRVASWNIPSCCTGKTPWNIPSYRTPSLRVWLITELQHAESVSISSPNKHYPYPSPVTRAHFTKGAQGDFMILSPAKGVRGGHRNSLVPHSWPHELR